MVLASMVAHDATGGGVMAALTGGPSLNVPGKAGEDSYLVGYTYAGISAEEVTITCAADDRWPTAGFSLKATSNCAAASGCKALRWFKNRTPVRAGEAITFTGTSGSNASWCILYFAVAPFNWRRPDEAQKVDAFKWSRTTAASGTNTTALTVQSGLVTLTAFGDHEYEIEDITIGGAFTTAPIIGCKIDKGDWPYTVYFLLPETDVAQLWEPIDLPSGILKVVKGDTMNISWLTDSTEQPTAIFTFKYQVGR